jgi:acetyl-CoA acetyltransferase
MQAVIAGYHVLPPEPDIPMALDEMIYTATSGALRDAGMGIADVSGSFMAASDLYDGRAISTMTLTGSTGSFRRNEMRVCNDSLAALMLAVADIESGVSDAVIVCTWSKLSDADRDSILPLGLEPVYSRGLGFHPGVALALRASAEQAAPTRLTPTVVRSADVATALILTRPTAGRRRRADVVGIGASTGPYLRPGDAVLAPVAKAAAAALASAGRKAGDVSRVRVGGMQHLDDAPIADAVGVPVDLVASRPERDVDLGYAAGLHALLRGLEPPDSGITLVIAGGGLSMETAYAAVVETP